MYHGLLKCRSLRVQIYIGALKLLFYATAIKTRAVIKAFIKMFQFIVMLRASHDRVETVCSAARQAVMSWTSSQLARLKASTGGVEDSAHLGALAD